jgi:hypothetical protein
MRLVQALKPAKSKAPFFCVCPVYVYFYGSCLQGRQTLFTVRYELNAKKQVDDLKIRTEEDCDFCEVRTEAEETVNDLNIKIKHNRL